MTIDYGKWLVEHLMKVNQISREEAIRRLNKVAAFQKTHPDFVDLSDS